MTFKHAKAILRARDITLTKVEGEYRVNIIGQFEPTAYYTDDLLDAVATGEAMARRMWPHRVWN